MKQSPKPTENRKFSRIPEKFTVQCQKIAYPLKSAEASPGMSRDISGNGISFKADQFFAPKTVLRLEMNLIGWQRYKKNVVSVLDDRAAFAPLTAIAEVVWARESLRPHGYEIGVRFIDIYADDRLALEKYLRQLTIDPP